MKKIKDTLIVLFLVPLLTFCSSAIDLDSAATGKRSAEAKISQSETSKTPGSGSEGVAGSPPGISSQESDPGGTEVGEEDQVAKAPIIISGSWLHCQAESGEGRQLSCLPRFAENEKSKSYVSEVTLVRLLSDGAQELVSLLQSTQETSESFRFSVPETAGVNGWISMVVRNDLSDRTYNLPLRDLGDQTSWELKPVHKIPETNQQQQDSQVDAGPEPGITVLNPEATQFSAAVENLHVGNGNLGGAFSASYNRDCKEAQIKASTLTGETLFLALRIGGDDDDDEDKGQDSNQVAPELKSIILSGICGVDRTGSAEVYAKDDDDHILISSVPIPEGATSLEIRDLNLRESGIYYLKISVGRVGFVSDPDDVFISKIESLYQGNVTFKAPSGKAPETD